MMQMAAPGGSGGGGNGGGGGQPPEKIPPKKSPPTPKKGSAKKKAKAKAHHPPCQLTSPPVPPCLLAEPAAVKANANAVHMATYSAPKCSTGMTLAAHMVHVLTIARGNQSASSSTSPSPASSTTGEPPIPPVPESWVPRFPRHHRLLSESKAIPPTPPVPACGPQHPPPQLITPQLITQLITPGLAGMEIPTTPPDVVVPTEPTLTAPPEAGSHRSCLLPQSASAHRTYPDLPQRTTHSYPAGHSEATARFPDGPPGLAPPALSAQPAVPPAEPEVIEITDEPTAAGGFGQAASSSGELPTGDNRQEGGAEPPEKKHKAEPPIKPKPPTEPPTPEQQQAAASLMEQQQAIPTGTEQQPAQPVQPVQPVQPASPQNAQPASPQNAQPASPQNQQPFPQAWLPYARPWTITHRTKSEQTVNLIHTG